MYKIPALLERRSKGPILAVLRIQDEVLHIVEVTCKGGTQYALGCKQKAGGYKWILGPTGKAELWNAMKETWDVKVI